jgi:HAD superfamily hydrolase (TIGR01509 family)
VFFDMDGTLVDSEPLWFETEVGIVAEYGFELGREHWVNVLGQPNDVAVAYLLQVSGAPLTPAELNRRIEAAMEAALGRGVEPVPGAKQLLNDLNAAGIPLALVSASSRRIVDACLASIGADHFAFTVSGDDVTHGKPHPEPYLSAARHFGVAPERCAVVEDSPNGAASGAAAGCRVVAVPQREALIGPHPLITVAGSLAEVTLESLRALFVPGPTGDRSSR